MKLSDFIRNRRKELKLTQKQLALEVGQNPGWVCMVESGLRLPGDITAPALAAALNVPDYIIRVLSGHSPVIDFRDDISYEELDSAIREFIDKVATKY